MLNSTNNQGAARLIPPQLAFRRSGINESMRFWHLWTIMKYPRSGPFMMHEMDNMVVYIIIPYIHIYILYCVGDKWYPCFFGQFNIYSQGPRKTSNNRTTVSSCRNSGKISPPTYAKSSPQSSKWASFGTAAVVWGNEHSRGSTASQLVLARDALRHLETKSLLDLDLCQINLWPRSPLASKWLQYYIGHACNSI